MSATRPAVLARNAALATISPTANASAAARSTSAEASASRARRQLAAPASSLKRAAELTARQMPAVKVRTLTSLHRRFLITNGFAACPQNTFSTSGAASSCSYCSAPSCRAGQFTIACNKTHDVSCQGEPARLVAAHSRCVACVDGRTFSTDGAASACSACTTCAQGSFASTPCNRTANAVCASKH